VISVRAGSGARSTEMPGHSCFLRDGNEIFHTYSTYGRGNEYTPASIRCSTSPLIRCSTSPLWAGRKAWEEPTGHAPVPHEI